MDGRCSNHDTYCHGYDSCDEWKSFVRKTDKDRVMFPHMNEQIKGQMSIDDIKFQPGE